jgi:hypothetical protein
MLKLMTILLFLAATPRSWGQTRNNNLGLGFVLGSPTALSLKYFQNRQEALDAGLAFSGSQLLLYGDYLRHFPHALAKQDPVLARITPYVGVGPFLTLRTSDNDKYHRHGLRDNGDHFAIGARIPFGLEWLSAEVPVGISLELAPGIAIIPATSGILHASIGFRYYL